MKIDLLKIVNTPCPKTKPAPQPRPYSTTPKCVSTHTLIGCGHCGTLNKPLTLGNIHDDKVCDGCGRPY